MGESAERDEMQARIDKALQYLAILAARAAKVTPWPVPQIAYAEDIDEIRNALEGE